MDQLSFEQLRQFADASTQPVFAAKDGLVSYANTAFSALQISVGTPLSSFFGVQTLLPTQQEIPCVVAGLCGTASVFPLKDGKVLYLLQLQEKTVPIHALSNTVRSIRSSLHCLYNAASYLMPRIEEAEDEKLQYASAGILQEIYCMEHMVQNIEWLQKLLEESYTLKPERTDIVNWLGTLCDHAADLLRYSEIELTTELPEKLFFGNLDCALAEHVIWNALSNAAASTKNGKIALSAKHRDKLLQVTVSSNGTLSAQARSNLFKRYQLPVDDTLGEKNAGFGLTVIQHAVQLHGGTMLFAMKPDETVAFTVTFDLTHTTPPVLHSPLPPQKSLDYGLVHLSPVLPRSAYDSRDIL